MKKAGFVLNWVLTALIILLPFGVILSACFGYTFKLANYVVFAVITALTAMGTAVFCTAAGHPAKNGTTVVVQALVMPLSLVNAVFYIFKCSTIGVGASMLICICCCGYLTARYGKPLALKIVSLVLSALMVLPIGFFAFIAFIFGDFVQNTVVQSVESPDGTYYAQVIDSDQGALGGDTLVDVYEKKGIDAFIFTITKNPQRVYWGEWGEFENMEIYWKDDNCLVIHSVEYTIK